MKRVYIYILLFCACYLIFCKPEDKVAMNAIAELADGWKGEIIATIDQSYAGWDVEIGDADNDGADEVLITGCPESRLYMINKTGDGWKTILLAENLAHNFPGMGLVVKVVDVNRDGKNEILLGTGQEMDEVAFFYAFQLEGERVIKKISSQPILANSNYTHNLACYDCDGDRLLEVFSAYCGSGEITRYDFDAEVRNIQPTKLHQLSGSGEESLIADVDNDGALEFLTSNSYRDEQAKVEIYEFTLDGELIVPARIVIDGFEDNKCFYASLTVGDVDNDGTSELIIGWKRKQHINKTTLLGYRIDETAVPVYTFAHEDESLDLGYFEKMMAVADADNDGRNELIVSTRGDHLSENITSRHFGYVMMYRIASTSEIVKTVLVDFHQEHVESSWLAVGDPDHDGKNEIVLATGKGDRKKAGNSYVVVIEK